jgi:hypothetical protein
MVTNYIALEPNGLMHAQLRDRANAAGFTEGDGSLLILETCGAENTTDIMDQLGDHKLQVDTMVSIMTLCCIPDPERTLGRLVRDVLKPGGQLLFYEHVLSPRPDVAWWQRFWTPIWRIAFDGCCLDRPTHLWIEAMQDTGENGKPVSMWSHREIWGKEGSYYISCCFLGSDGLLACFFSRRTRGAFVLASCRQVCQT